MNCPSRTDDNDGREGWNQSPNLFAADITTKEDFNGRTNDIAHGSADADGVIEDASSLRRNIEVPPKLPNSATKQLDGHVTIAAAGGEGGGRSGDARSDKPSILKRAKKFAVTYGSFIGPGFMVRFVPLSLLTLTLPTTPLTQPPGLCCIH